MDLANLGFVVDTKSIKDGIEALRQLQAAALGVTQTFKSAEQSTENLGKTTEQSEDKSAQATEQSTKRKKKTQDDYLTFLSEALDKSLARELQAQQRKEQAQKSSAKSSSKVVADSAQEEQSAIDRTIEKLRIKKQEIAAGARSSEATAVAIAKLGGASEQQIKTIRDLMREINSIGGKNPFDSVVGELRRVKEEARGFQAIIDASNKEVGLTAKELQEIASLTSKINSIGKDTGATQDEINRRVEAATSEYREQVRQKNLLKEKVDDIAEAERIASQAASANKRVQEQISDELRKQALLKEGFTKREAGFIVSSSKSGVAEVDAIALLAAENTTDELAKANEKLAKTSKDVTVAYDAQVKAYEKNQDSVQRNLEATRKKLEQVKIEASLAAQGLSRTTAVGVVNLQQRGASQADIDTYIKTRKEIEKITAEARKASLASRGLSTILREISPAVGAVGVVALFTQIGVAAIKAADQMTLLTSRMKLVSGEGANLVEVQNNLLKTANESRASLSDVTTLYVRIAPALRKIGFDTKDTATVVDSFSKSLLISGANSREASAAILQFSQALAAGRLNGDEFRSISEAAPEFLRIFAEATGVAAGALKDLSAEGELTTEVISSVLLVMNKDIAKTAANIDVSFSQAIQVLGNNLLVAVDSVNKMTGATNALANATIAVGEFVGDATKEIIFFYESNRELFSTLGKVIGFLVDAATVFGVYKGALIAGALVQKAWTATVASSTAALATARVATLNTLIAVGGLTTGTTAAAGATSLFTIAVKGLTAAFAANPIGFIATALAGVASYFIFASDSADDYKNSIEDVADTTEQKLIKNLVKEQAELQRLIDLQKERDKQLKESGSKREASDTQYGGKKLSDVIDAQAKAAGDAQRQLDSYRVVVDQSSVAWQNATRIIEEFKAKHKDVPAELDAEFKALQTVTGENAKLKAQLDAVGKSSLQLAEAKAIELTATAGIIEANATELALKGNLNDSTIAQINSALLRADALREQAKLVVELAKKEQQFSGGRGPVSKKNDYDDFIKSANKTLESVSKLNEEESESVRLVKELQVLLPKLTKSKIDNALAIISQVSAQEDKNNKDKEAAKIQKEIDDLIADEEKIRKDLIKTQEDTIKSLEEENRKIEEEIFLIGKSSSEIRQYEIEKKRAQLQGLTSQEDIIRLQREIDLLEERNEKLGRKEGVEAAIKAAEDTQKEFEKIQDDIAKSVGDAIIAGGQKGKDILKNMFKAQVFRIFVEPVIRGGVKQLNDVVSGKGNLSDLSGLVETLSASSLGGGEAVALQAGLQKLAVNPQILTDIGNKIFFDASSDFLSSTGKLLADSSNAISSFAGELAPYAGSIISFVNGDYASGIGSAAGVAIATAFGQALGSFAGPIGAFVGGIIGEKLLGGLFGGGKISATSLDASFGKGVVDNLNTQYSTLVEALGGTKNTGVSFGAGGNTGRQGQNPNFNIGASLNGSQIFNSNQTAEGQADGLFLSGEVALNEANLTDQSTRALIAVLQKTKFDKNIEDVFRGVSAASSSFEELNNALSDAQLLRKINTEFANLDGSLKTLAGTSIETVKTFIGLAGGVEKLAELQGQYIQSIYSEEEKLKLATDNLNRAFAGLNLSVPKSAQEFRKLVDAQDLSTIQGQATYLALLQLSSAFAEVNQGTEQAVQLQKELSASMLNTSSAIRETIRKTLFNDLTPVNQLTDLQLQFDTAVQKALNSEGQGLITAGENVDRLITEVLQSASDIYASGPEYQRIQDMILSQADVVADRLEALAPLTYQEETVALLQSISQSSAATVQALTGSASAPTVSTPTVSTTTTSTPVVSLPMTQGSTVVQNVIDVNAIVLELRALRTEVAESGDINLKIVTEDGRVITEETLKQIKDRSKRGELVIYANGVK